ncbi:MULTISPECIES: hypothetical protein [unclassified Janthinobacterium]|uniref:hypothetical protein n=1 Tax=unclassified Janthinobacterium TaxID=2610881 RepID=UPI001D109A01|nr:MULTISPECIES: hypothetical protein [unclassified Janthinobacterium]
MRDSSIKMLNRASETAMRTEQAKVPIMWTMNVSAQISSNCLSITTLQYGKCNSMLP